MLMMIIIIIVAVETLLYCHVPLDVISNGAMANGGFTAEEFPVMEHVNHPWMNTWNYAWDNASFPIYLEVENAQYQLGGGNIHVREDELTFWLQEVTKAVTFFGLGTVGLISATLITDPASVFEAAAGWLS